MLATGMTFRAQEQHVRHFERLFIRNGQLDHLLYNERIKVQAWLGSLTGKPDAIPLLLHIAWELRIATCCTV